MTRSGTREFVGQFAAPLRTYLHTETGSAGLLLGATILALVWANSPLSGLYEDVWGMHVSIRFGDFFVYDHDLRHWVNDGLMVLFFFVIGLELRRQLSMGELTDRARFTCWRSPSGGSSSRSTSAAPTRTPRRSWCSTATSTRRPTTSAAPSTRR